MLEINPTLPGHESTARRAGELFDQHRQEIFKSTDHLFARLMLFQWLAGIFAAVCISPLSWEGQSSSIHIHVWAAIFLGGAISLFPIWLTRALPGSVFTRHAVAVGQMLMSSLLIHLTGGRIETHFHIFGSLVILSFYRDWRVLIPATIIVALDHFVRGVYWPYSVYGVLSASPWRSMEHAGWVIFEDVFLVISCLRSVREMRFIANRTAELEASEEQSRKIFAEAPVGMAVVGLDHQFIQINTRLAQMVGYTEQDLKALKTSDINHPEDMQAGEQLVRQLFEDKTMLRCAMEERYIRKDNELLWVTRTACVIRDESGKPLHYVMMMEDITERKKAAAALQESEERFRQFAENIGEVFWMTDPAKNEMLYISPAYTDIWGRTREELYSSPRAWLDAIHEEDRARVLDAAMTKQIQGNYKEEYRIVRPDGSLRWIKDQAFPVRNKAGEIYRVAGIAEDITERKRTEETLKLAKTEAEQANQAKSEFLSRMSHELRTPLNAVLGFAQLLERQNPTDIQRGRVGHIITAGRHLLNLINEVLDISRIEAGGLQLSLEPVCITDVLQETLDLMRPLATQRGITLSNPTTTDDAQHVLADRQRFKQVLLNLMTNAVKYGPADGTILLSCKEHSDNRFRIAVTDDGAGIPPEKLGRLFIPFDRIDAEQSGIEGFGLGLALSKRLTEAMGGIIGVESTVGAGSTFWIELPATESPATRLGSVRPINAALAASRAAFNKRTVLYIEDNLSNLTLIEQLLDEQNDVELMTAMQGRIGLDLAREHLPDLILLDLHLPDLPGWEVLAQLKAGKATRSIPVIVISADATARQIERLIDAGAQTYLTKPLDVSQFLKAVSESGTARKTSLEYQEALEA